jgi:hypothetical protein
MPVTAQLSSWWIAHTALMLVLPLVFAVWGLYASVGGRLWRGELVL